VRFFRRVYHLALRSMAWFILEPRLLSSRWEVRESALDRLRPDVDKLYEANDRAYQVFAKLNVCIPCGGICCVGDFSRLTVYDHVVHLVAGMPDPPRWTYRLHPFHSAAYNHTKEGICPDLVKGTGCKFPPRLRPANCVLWVCPVMEPVMTAECWDVMREVRRVYDRVQWRIAILLALGGMRRKAVAPGG
jgi:hypothetical protein